MKTLARISTIVLLVLTLSCKGKQEEQPRPKPGLIYLELAIPPEISESIASSLEQFYINNPMLGDGSIIKVKTRIVPAVEAALQLAEGNLKIDLWISSSPLIGYVNEHIVNLGAKQIECRPLFSTPLVFAVNPRKAAFFGETDHEFSWNSFYNYTFGESKKSLKEVSFTQPYPSAQIGLTSLLQLLYLLSNSNEPLTLEKLQAGPLANSLKELEGYATNYSIDENILLQNLSNIGADANMFTLCSEQALINFNAARGKSWPALIAMYPKEGTVQQDYSICMSDADWVTPGQRIAARELTKFLAERYTQETVLKKGFRPLLPELQIGPPISLEYGVTPSLPKVGVPAPETAAVSFLMKNWRGFFKPSAVLMVMDTSGSTEGAPLRVGQEQFRNLMAGLSPRDQLGLISFASINEVRSEFTNEHAQVIAKLDQLVSIGGSSVYDAMKYSIDYMLKAKLDGYRKTLIVYTDGNDRNSNLSLESLLRNTIPEAVNENVNVIIVGVGRESNFADLKEIAESAHGFFYQGGLDDMKQIFTMVNSNM